MSEAKKMDEKEFFRAVQDWEDVESLASSSDHQRLTLAARLGIELTREEEPLPCPFDGAAPMILVDRAEGGFVVRCPKCDIRIPGAEVLAFRDRSYAIAAWNRRHQPPPPKIPTREELGDEMRKRFFDDVEGDNFSLWRHVADAAFRAFGLEPRKEEDHG